jgi:hypothetical protein
MCLRNLSLRNAACGLLMVLPGALGAQGVTGPAVRDPSMPWMLMLAALVDEDSYENLLAGFHIGLGDETWLSLSAGSSRAPSTDTEVRAGLFTAGIEHDFGPVGLALTAERWGDEDDLETEDWRGEIFVAEDRFRIALLLEQRDIDIHFAGAGGPFFTGPRRADIAADGIGVGGRLGVAPLWRLYGSWMEYDYPPGLRLIPRADSLNLLSTSAVTLAYSLVDEYSRLGIERTFGRKLVNLDFGSDRSAIDGARLESVSAAVLWPVGRRMDLEVHLGTSRTEGYESALYGGFSLVIYGGG